MEVKRKIIMPYFRINFDAVHYKFIATLDSYEQSFRPAALDPGSYRLKIKIPTQSFRPGAYTINASICQKAFDGHLFYWYGAGSFLVRHPVDRYLSPDPGIVHLDADFKLEHNGQASVCVSYLEKGSCRLAREL